MGSTCTSSESGRQPITTEQRLKKKPKKIKRMAIKRNYETDLFSDFTHPYLFKEQNIIIMKHNSKNVNLRGKCLCIDKTSCCNTIAGYGKIDVFSKFIAIPDSNIYGRGIKLKSLYNGKFIRISSVISDKKHKSKKHSMDCKCAGNYCFFKVRHLMKYMIDCNGDGDKSCLFKVHHISEKPDGHVKLESVNC